MSIKIKVDGSSVQATNTETGIIIIKEPTNSVWYVESRLQDGVIQLYDSNDSQRISANFQVIFLSEAINEDNIAFTEDTFRDFVFENLGQTQDVSGQTFVQRVVADGGTLFFNPCY